MALFVLVTAAWSVQRLTILPSVAAAWTISTRRASCHSSVVVARRSIFAIGGGSLCRSPLPAPFVSWGQLHQQQQSKDVSFIGSLPRPFFSTKTSSRLSAVSTTDDIVSLTAPNVDIIDTAMATSTSHSNDVSNGSEPPSPWPKFAELTELHPLLARNAIENMKYVAMTEIQARTWEAASRGTDVLGRARTGTGKTVAFLLPALQQLLLASSSGKGNNNNSNSNSNSNNSSMIQMLILSPTRELAAQIHDQAEQLTKGGTMRHQVMFGGASKPKDITLLEKRMPNVLVATPGRLRDHLQTTTIRGRPFAQYLSQIQILVLDETDRLLDMGFRIEVENIMSYLSDRNNRQTLLFSATVPPEVKDVIGKTMRPNFVTVDCIHEKDPSSHTNHQVDQSHIVIPSATRLVTGTVDVICKLMTETKAAGEPLKLVVFFNTAHMVAFYASLFTDGLGIPVLELHSRKSQSYRTRTADAFRAAKEAILFTSDVSARGVDYPGVTDVVQFGIPDSRESYIHRLGRTGRAGKQGEGLLVLSDLEKKFLNQLQGLDVPVNKDYQALIDASPSTEMMHKLDHVLSGIGSERDKKLNAHSKAAYRSMLGFYNGKLAKLGCPGTDTLVEFANNFSKQTGLLDLPEIEQKTAKKMGLFGVTGLNIVKNASVQSSGGGRGGQQGGNGGGGRGGGRGGGGDRAFNDNGPGGQGLEMSGGSGRGGRGGGRNDRTRGSSGQPGGQGRGGQGGGGRGRGGGSARGSFGGQQEMVSRDGAFTDSRSRNNGSTDGARRTFTTSAPTSVAAKRHEPPDNTTTENPKKPKKEGDAQGRRNASTNGRRRTGRGGGS